MRRFGGIKLEKETIDDAVSTRLIRVFVCGVLDLGRRSERLLKNVDNLHTESVTDGMVSE